MTMGEFLVFVLAGIVGAYCYKYSRMYRALVDGKDTEREDNKDK